VRRAQTERLTNSKARFPVFKCLSFYSWCSQYSARPHVITSADAQYRTVILLFLLCKHHISKQERKASQQPTWLRRLGRLLVLKRRQISLKRAVNSCVFILVFCVFCLKGTSQTVEPATPASSTYPASFIRNTMFMFAVVPFVLMLVLYLCIIWAAHFTLKGDKSLILWIKLENILTAR
jgi:hypothetical protein